MLNSKKLSIQILKVSLIVKLIIQITLTLIHGIFLNSVISKHLISQLTPVANKSISNYLLMKETEILHQILDHSKFASRYLEHSSGHWVMCTYTMLKGFSVCYETVLSLLKVVTNKIYFRHQYHFPLNVFLMRLILI